MQVQLIDTLRYHHPNTTMPTEAKPTKKRLSTSEETVPQYYRKAEMSAR